MSTGVPVTGSATGATGGESGASVALDQGLVNAIAAAVQTAVSQATSQMQSQINSLTENIDKISQATTSDTDTATVSRSSIDPAASQRRLEAYAELSLSNCIEFCKQAGLRSLDHFAALPPIAPRSASGPGTSAS